ncbi:S8 family serine peptidase [Noviherbaspirillum sp. 1P10PC]|uniref:S8 family serine peptidase n=1 Tax=Noviherbaspirillum sp. 1P10PC TaxID=3132292 RepID=UPI0039A388DB
MALDLLHALSIPAPLPPRITPKDHWVTFDLEVDKLLDVKRAQREFKVDGAGLTAAVLDTGLRTTHECFTGRVIGVKNFTEEDGSDPNNVTDWNGHGTNVAGIIAAGTNDERRGIAPAANLVSLKVIPAPNLSVIIEALEWVYANAERLKISVANLSLGVPNTNFKDDTEPTKTLESFAKITEALATKRVAVVAAAGNSYYSVQAEGMSIPAIFRNVISVGAVYDESFKNRSYSDGATAFSTHADQLTPFTQRLSKETSPECYTDIFSSGGAVTSAGAADDTAASTQDGTSQASPTVAGIVLLLQQYYLRRKHEMPTIALLQDLLRASSTWIIDGDDDDDNVKHTNRKYPRANAFQSLVALHKAIQLGLV